MKDAVILVTDLSKVYGVSFEVRRGAVLSLLGPNNAVILCSPCCSCRPL